MDITPPRLRKFEFLASLDSRFLVKYFKSKLFKLIKIVILVFLASNLFYSEKKPLCFCKQLQSLWVSTVPRLISNILDVA